MNILIATGGSGGHLIPAQLVAEQLKEKGLDVACIGSLNKSCQSPQDLPFIDLKAEGLTSKGPIAFLRFCFSQFSAFIKCIRHLRGLKPDLVCGFGGYGSFSVVMAALLLNVPTMIHEQNVIPGRANRILGRFVKKIALSFKETEQYFDPKKTLWTGCPCQLPKENYDREEIFKSFQLDKDKTTILVCGGSQGSEFINEVFLKTIVLFPREMGLQVIHLTGSRQYSMIKEAYEVLSYPAAVFDYSDRIQEAYAVCDGVISRAGAVTIHEVAHSKRPAILIPYPFAGGHQKANAVVLEKSRMAQVIDQKECSKELLKEAIIHMIEKSKKFKEEETMENVFRDNAVENISDALIGLTS